MGNKVTVRDGEQKREKIGLGSIWRREDGYIYMLAEGAGSRKVVLFCLNTGYDFASANTVNYCQDINNEEWDIIKRGQTFTRIYHVEIEAERGE